MSDLEYTAREPGLKTGTQVLGIHTGSAAAGVFD